MTFRFSSSRPRPLADAPVEALVARAPELAREWLLATLADAPFDLISQLPTAEFAGRAPDLCAALARALGSDAELARLEAAGDLHARAAEVVALAGASDAAAATAGVERLRRVLLRGALSEVDSRDPELVLHLSDRLAYACSLLAGVRPEGGSPVALVPIPDDERASDTLRVLDTRLSAARRDGRPLVLLLADLDDRGRLDLAEGSTAPGGGPSERLLGAARSVMRDGDAVLADDEGRAWLVVDGVTRAGAEAIARRLEAAVRALGSWRGAPLAVAVGVARHPGDGDTGASLAAAAEEGLFAAAAAGSGLGLRGR